MEFSYPLKSGSYGSISSRSQISKTPVNKPTEITHHIPKLILASSLCLVLIFGISIKNNQPKLSSRIPLLFEETIVEALDQDLALYRNGYSTLPYFGDDASEYTKYAFLENFDSIIEPHATMLLRVTNAKEDTGSSWMYNVCDSNSNCITGDMSTTTEAEIGTSFTLGCESFEEYQVIVKKVDDKGLDIKSFSMNAICMYVRREISSLTTEDLSDAMDAMYTLWNTTEEEGQAIYGEKYHHASYFSAAHDFNAAQQDADHIHEGLGFLPQHIKLTNMFENAVRAVDPSFSLPYWDFTRDVASNLTIFESIMFTSETFGSINKPTDHYWGFTYRNDDLSQTGIADGRWKATPADINSLYRNLSLTNGFGYMRGPWNMNPSPTVSRFSAYSPTLPSCSDYYGGLGMPDFMQFLQTAPYGAHASTHGVIGSVFGCDKLDPWRENGIIQSDDNQLSICKKWGFYMKELYRANYLKSRSDCSTTSLTEEGINCGFICSEDDGDTSFENELKITFNANYLSSAISSDQWGYIKDFICDGDGSKIFVGDHLESASPSDPSFWPIHPTQERLLQLKYMIGSFTSYSWPTSAMESYVCDKSSCYSSLYGKKGSYTSCCYGHYENDQLLDFTTGSTDTSTGGIGPTNKEIIEATNPTREDYSMPYIYDHFEWEHCEEDFNSMIELMYKSAHKYDPTSSPTLPPSPTQYPSSSPVLSTSSPTMTLSDSPSLSPSLFPSLSPTITLTSEPTSTVEEEEETEEGEEEVEMDEVDEEEMEEEEEEDNNKEEEEDENTQDEEEKEDSSSDNVDKVEEKEEEVEKEEEEKVEKEDEQIEEKEEEVEDEKEEEEVSSIPVIVQQPSLSPTEEPTPSSSSSTTTTTTSSPTTRAKPKVTSSPSPSYTDSPSPASDSSLSSSSSPSSSSSSPSSDKSYQPTLTHSLSYQPTLLSTTNNNNNNNNNNNLTPTSTSSDKTPSSPSSSTTTSSGSHSLSPTFLATHKPSTSSSSSSSSSSDLENIASISYLSSSSSSSSSTTSSTTSSTSSSTATTPATSTTSTSHSKTTQRTFNPTVSHSSPSSSSSSSTSTSSTGGSTSVSHTTLSHSTSTTSTNNNNNNLNHPSTKSDDDDDATSPTVSPSLSSTHILKTRKPTENSITHKPSHNH